MNKTLFSDDIEILIDGKILINKSHFVINEKTKYCIIGNNGCGKTTLINYLYNKIKEYEDILLLDQHIEIDNKDISVLEFILNANSKLYEIYNKSKELEEKDDLTDIETNMYNEFSEYLYVSEFDKYENEALKILNGLGFNDVNNRVINLSGGWKIRLALGRALLRKPNILILDEPTNHLDINASIWLYNYLENYKKTLIVITHQIYLVNNIADITYYIGNLKLNGNEIYTIRGDYDSYKQFVKNTKKEMDNEYNKFKKRIDEMKKKSTDKKVVQEFIKKNFVNRPPKEYLVNIDFVNISQFKNNDVIKLEDVSFGYDKDIFNNLNISIKTNDRIVLVGPNGIGKTSFFKLCSEKINPKSGYVIKNDKLRVGYYYQEIIDNLPLDKTPIEYLQSLDNEIDSGKCRGILGKLGLRKNEISDYPTIKIKNLSGGQKARLSFASLQILEPHLILLDEPSNHLDIESIEGLINGINNFNGAIVIITHDLYLIENINNSSIYELKDKNINKFYGEFDNYCEYILKN
jgi:ATP-binding cassette subfamily F protein 1